MFLLSYGSTTKYLRYFQKVFRISALCLRSLVMAKRIGCSRKFRLLLLVFFFCFGYFLIFQFDEDIMNSRRWIVRALKRQTSQDQEIIVLNSTSMARQHPLVTPYPYPYKFIMNSSEKCQKRNPFLVLLVIGESHDVKARDAIRRTWGNESNYGNIDVISIFLVGISPIMNGAIQRLLEEESTIYGDIVQQDFLDTYHNLTLKTLMGMEWMSKFCPNASYAMKVDNDVFVNVDYLVHQLLHPELPPRSNYLTGFVVEDTPPNRDKHTKWYLPEEIYPSKIFPPYPAGPGYVFSGDMAKKIYDVAQEILVFSVEDAFIGICLYKMNISLTPSPEKLFHGLKIDYSSSVFSHVVMVHHYKNEDLLILWSDFWNMTFSGNHSSPSLSVTQSGEP